MTFDEFLAKTLPPPELARFLNLNPLTIVNVWAKRGVPEKYWPKLERKFGVKPMALYEMNLEIRGVRQKPC